MTGTDTTPPAVGMLATVRNRRGIASAVEPFDGPDGRLHLVTIEYTDGDGVAEDRLVWEIEPAATVVPPAALPQVPPSGPDDRPPPPTNTDRG